MNIRSERSRGEGCLSDLRFDAWAADELSASETAPMLSHLESCARCRARRQELLRERESFLNAYPPRYPGPTQSARTSVPRFRRAAPWLGGLAAAALAMLLVWPVERAQVPERSKGRTHIGYFIKRGESVVRGEPGAHVQAGDRVRLLYTSADVRYLSVFGLDGSGRADAYFPAADHAVAIEPAIERPLPIAIELDATPGTEQLIALFCSDAVALAPLREQLARTGKLSVPEGCTVDRLLLHKGEP